jgi:hypothetical protein
MPIVIHLPNGRAVDIETKAGANYFILHDDGQSFEFFTSNLVDVKELCDRIHKRKNKKPTRDEMDRLVMMYASAAALAGQADNDAFAKIPQSEIQAYLEHVKVEIDRMAEPTSNWSKTGDLVYLYEQALVQGFMYLFMHQMPCKLAYEMDLFQVIAKLSSAPSKISADPAEIITLLVSNALVSTFVHTGLPSTEQAFKMLESCGMLEQFIRLSVMSPSSEPGVLKFYDELLQCKSLVKKCFAKDQPCGEAVQEILNNSRVPNQAVLSRLKLIMSFNNFVKKQSEMPSGIKEGYKYCRNCNKLDVTLEFQNSLKRCSRCRQAYYCSRECQVADWKSHKPLCQPITRSDETEQLWTEQTVHDFILNNYASILREIVEASSETGLDKCDLLLELDFYNSDNDVAPALRSPPEFEVADSKGYFEGDRPNEPDWFRKNEDKVAYKKNISSFTKVLKDTYNRLTDNHLLLVVRNPDGNAGCYRFNLQSSMTRCQMFSQEVVSAASKALYDDNFEPLTSLFGKGSNEIQVLRREFGTMPDEADMELIRQMLNRNFGANF